MRQRKHAALQGDALAEAGEYADAEDAFVAAKAPEKAVKMFRDASMWDDALRLARALRPDMLRELERARDAAVATGGAGGAADAKIRKAKLYERQVRIVVAVHCSMCSCNSARGCGAA